jgi:hypothetical protein
MLLMQVARPGAANGIIEGPPYHCDINGTRALFGTPDWNWPAPPYPRMTHSSGAAELALILERTAPRPDPA